MTAGRKKRVIILVYWFYLYHCKTVNLVNILDWSRGILSVNRKIHVMCHVPTLRIFSTLKKLRFWQNCEDVFNQLNYTNWVELHKGHVQESKGEVMCKGHVEGSRAGGMQVAWGDLHLQIGRVITVQTLWVKRKCQLVVRLKANKSYQELFCSLSSYINLLNIRLFAQVFGLCVSATGDLTVTTSGFVLILLLVILLWLYCSSRIVDRIALIALLWPYRWLYRFDYPNCITDCITLIFVLGNVFCFWYCSHYLLLKVWAIQDIIHRLDESRTYIWSSGRTHLRTLNHWIM